ncbi:MAG: hypothetical protein GX241_03300 [Ruminococcaceae bacterium]|nr:hypothetical protein [Oscillospiraceae bacterium]
MLFGDGSQAAIQAVEAAKLAVRSVDNFNWTFITLLALVVICGYIPRIRDKKWDSIAAALALYGVHWIYEIANAVICHFTGFALWHVTPESTTFILLIGVCWELSLMFSIAGFQVELLPEDKNMKILGMNNRVFFAIIQALGFSVFEIFLAATPSFVWVYKWWGTIPVWITVYIPFFLASNLTYDMPREKQKKFVGILWALVAILLIVLIPLGII